LSELADYRKIHGHCNVPQTQNYSENTKLGYWVGRQRGQYKLHRDGKKSRLTALRIQALKSLGFEWHFRGAAWEDRLSELADFHKIHGHCNVPKTQNYSENAKLGKWVGRQRGSIQVAPRWKEIAFDRIANSGIEKLPWRRLGKLFERACRLPQNTRALQYSKKLQRKLQARSLGRNAKEELQVASNRKDIAYDHRAYPIIGKHGCRVSF
jgi:hypothetical protein